MATRTKPRSAPRRKLREWSASAPSGSPLKVDREKRVIYGVRVLGRFSCNSHGLKEATGGTEYTQACMQEALKLYEGAEVLANHEDLTGDTSGLKKRRTHRGVEYVVGVLREARMDGSGDKECIRADLHYFDSHPMSARVLEDVERGLGVLGLSHDARAGRERFDPANRRLVIESLAAVKSVDLVRKPATNRNLWEGEHAVSTTLREQLEERLPKLSKNRKLWARRLLEDDAMAPAVDAPVEAPADDGGDEEDALWSGFQAAIGKVLDKYKSGECDAKECGKQIMDWIKAHEKLTSKDEPEAPPEKSDSEGSEPEKTESRKDEAARLKHQLAVRDLFEDLGVKPDKVLRESAENQPTLEAARKLIEREKARGGAPRAGGYGGGGGTGAGKGKAPVGAKEFADSIKD